MKFRKVVHFFDRLEDKVRARLSRHPITYAFLGGIGIVLFWKGVWETAEYIPALHGIPSILLGLALLLPTGLFVSFFIGDNIILSGYRHEKKMVELLEKKIAAGGTAVRDVVPHDPQATHAHASSELESK